MSGIQISAAKAPWVMFERRQEEDRNASIAQGRYVAKDVDYALITPHGSKDQIEITVEDWFTQKAQQVAEGRFEGEWLNQYKRGYASWKEGKEIPLDGTPIINWPLVSPAQVRMLQDLHILTVEVLAESNEEAIRRIGMGGRALRDKARAFLEQATGPGKIAEEIVALKGKVDAMEQIAAALKEQNELMKLQLAAAQPQFALQPPVQAPDSGGIGAADLLEDDPTPRSANRKQL